VIQDLLQIGLEHHRASRLRQAEAAYRGLLDREPNHPDALHWLGVLMHQAGRDQEAVAFLQRAVSARPDDAAFPQRLGHACLRGRQRERAVVA